MSTDQWVYVSFKESPIEVIDGDRGKNYPHQDEFFEKGYCLFLNANNVTLNGFDFGQKQFVTKEKDELLRKGKLNRFDIVLTTRGTVGNVAYFNNTVPYKNIRINSGMVIFRSSDSTIYDHAFLYQYLKSPIFKNQVLGYSTGSAQPQLPIRDIYKIKIPIPPLAEQRAIADVLSALDDKIELNRRMNATLEQLAQAIFKHMFIDNPDRENWEEKTLDSVCGFEYGKALKETSRVFGIIPVYGSNGLIGYHNEFLVKGPGIVVGRKGNPGIITFVHIDFFPIDTTFYVVPKNNLSIFWLFFTLSDLNLPNLGADSAVPGLNRNIAYMSLVTIPPTELLFAFENLIAPLFEKIHINNNESQTLAELRDTLLPKLMSGQVRVKL